MTDRSERVGIATLAWRKRAKAAFKKLGRGSPSQCARELRRTRAQISRVINGGTATSAAVLDISRWLKIPPPTMPVANERVVHLFGIVDELEPEEVEVIVSMAEVLRAKKGKRQA